MDWANGIDNSIVSNEVEDLKSVGNSRTFDATNDYQELKSMINYLSRLVSSRAKEDKLYGNSISITIKYDDFKVNTRSKKIDHPTNDYEEIFTQAMLLLDKNYDGDKYVRLLGVTLQNVAKIETFAQQLSLFNSQDRIPRDLKMNKLVDDINKQLGKNVVSIGEKRGENG